MGACTWLQRQVNPPPAPPNTLNTKFRILNTPNTEFRIQLAMVIRGPGQRGGATRGPPEPQITLTKPNRGQICNKQQIGVLCDISCGYPNPALKYACFTLTLCPPKCTFHPKICRKTAWGGPPTPRLGNCFFFNPRPKDSGGGGGGGSLPRPVSLPCPLLRPRASVRPTVLPKVSILDWTLFAYTIHTLGSPN